MQSAAFTAHPSLKMVIVVDNNITPLDPIVIDYAIATSVKQIEILS